MVVEVCNSESTLTDPDGLDVKRLRAQLVVEGAILPASPEAREMLQDRGMAVVPDFMANAVAVPEASPRTGRTFDSALAWAQDRVYETMCWRGQLRGDVVTVRRLNA